VSREGGGELVCVCVCVNGVGTSEKKGRMWRTVAEEVRRISFELRQCLWHTVEPFRYSSGGSSPLDFTLERCD